MIRCLELVVRLKSAAACEILNMNRWKHLIATSWNRGASILAMRSNERSPAPRTRSVSAEVDDGFFSQGAKDGSHFEKRFGSRHRGQAKDRRLE